jgi:hypothetical protein
LVSALDSLSLIGIPRTDVDIKKALEWLKINQSEVGIWNLSYTKNHKTEYNKKQEEMQLWVNLAICRILKRFLD